MSKSTFLMLWCIPTLWWVVLQVLQKCPQKFEKLLVLVFSMGNKPLQKHNLMALLLLLPCYRAQSIDACKIWVIKGPVTAVQLILFNFANYLPSIAMELKVSKEITCKWQNQRSETNKYVSWALFLKLQAAGIKFEKLLGWTVFKNPNFNPFQSCSVLPICGICCFCYVILTFLLSSYFYVSVNVMGIL